MNIGVLTRQMPRRSGIILLLLVLFSGLPQAIAGERAAWVADGDSVRLESGRWVRLQGIDAPEMGRDGQPDQVHARQSRLALQALLWGQELELVEHGRDRHGRILGSLYREDGTDVARALVADGHAFYYFHADHVPSLRATLLTAQREAMDRGRGFWPMVGELAASGGPWLGNRRSGRAFPAHSLEAAEVGRFNRVAFGDLCAVFRAGYCPARAVSPWPRVSP